MGSHLNCFSIWLKSYKTGTSAARRKKGKRNKRSILERRKEKLVAGRMKMRRVRKKCNRKMKIRGIYKDLDFLRDQLESIGVDHVI
jgi:hypothetical protein